MKVIFKVNSNMSLAYGIVILIACLLTVFKIYRGSKSQFACVLMAFTFADAINNLVNYFMDAFP